MAFYTALTTVWNSSTQPPAGVTGTALSSSMTTTQKLSALNAWTVTGSAQRATLDPSSILNAVVFADLAALTQLQVTQLTLLLQGTLVDASVGTSIRLGIQTLFTGKAQTLSNLGALVAPFDSPVVSWCRANGYPEANGGGGGITSVDLSNAGGLA